MRYVPYHDFRPPQLEAEALVLHLLALEKKKQQMKFMQNAVAKMQPRKQVIYSVSAETAPRRPMQEGRGKKR